VFIRDQITRLSKAESLAAELRENIAGDATELSPLDATPSLPSLEAEPGFILGSKQVKQKLIIGNLQTAGPDFDQAFTSFRSRISNAIQAMNSEPTNIVQDAQKVMSPGLAS
jgi:hypothetical protein